VSRIEDDTMHQLIHMESENDNNANNFIIECQTDLLKTGSDS